MRYIILFFLLPIIACNTTPDKTEAVSDYVSIPGFKKVGELKLDNQSLGGLNFEVTSCTFDPKTGAGSVAFLSMGSANHFLIKVFDLENGALQREIPIEMEGPNGVGTEVTKITLINEDSLLVYNQWLGFYTLVNGNGEVLNKIQVAEIDAYENGYFSPSSREAHHRDVFTEGKLYIPGAIPWATRAKVSEQLLILDILNGSQDFSIKRPEIYETAILGITTFYILSLAYNPFTKSLLLNFPALNEIWDYSLKTEEINITPAFSELVGEFKPLSSVLKKNISGIEYRQHGYTQNYFSGIFFDPSNSFIYRLGVIFPSDNNIEDPYSKAKYSILVLNEKKEIIDDILLDSYPRTLAISFTGLKGLYVYNPELSEENEDVVVFDIISYRGRGESSP